MEEQSCVPIKTQCCPQPPLPAVPLTAHAHTLFAFKSRNADLCSLMLAFLRIFSNSYLANSESVRWNELNTKVGGLWFCPRHLCCLNDYKTLLLKIEKLCY